MSPCHSAPTPYPEINDLLRRLLAAVRQILGDHFIGLILQGSLATGHFEPARSDIDFVVVTAGELPAPLLTALAAMHAELAAGDLNWASRLEGSYIPRRALRRYEPTAALHPALRVDGSFDIDHHGRDWVIQRHVIREFGVALAGPDPKTLVDPASPDKLQRAALETLEEWWVPKLADHALVQDREYQAFAVLTMCRALYTIQHGTVVSKREAAGWTRRTVGEQWAGLIERALAWPAGSQPDLLEETLDFIRHTLALARQKVETTR